MTDMAETGQALPEPARRRSAVVRFFQNLSVRRGVTAILVFLILWEFGSRFDEWFGDA